MSDAVQSPASNRRESRIPWLPLAVMLLWFTSDDPTLGVVLADAEGRPGACVVSVVEDGAADEAGIEPGDLLTGLGDRPFEWAADVSAGWSGRRPGDKVEPGFVRGGRDRGLAVKLRGRRPCLLW